jgi:hypothetical protein
VNLKWLVTALFAVVALAPVAGCKQGIGERCQQDSDCASGICSTSEPKICQGNGSGTDMTQIDAACEPHPDGGPCLPTDAPAPPPIDAAADAPP